MSDRGRYDSAMFWLAFGTAAAVIGLALMTIGVSRTARGDSLLSSGWFDGGLGLLALGGCAVALGAVAISGAPPRRGEGAGCRRLAVGL
jgi:hypothetical protein